MQWDPEPIGGKIAKHIKFIISLYLYHFVPSGSCGLLPHDSHFLKSVSMPCLCHLLIGHPLAPSMKPLVP